MSEKISLDVLLPVAKDLYLKTVFDNSPLAKMEKASKSKEKVLEEVADEFTIFVAHLEKRLCQKD